MALGKIQRQLSLPFGMSAALVVRPFTFIRKVNTTWRMRKTFLSLVHFDEPPCVGRDSAARSCCRRAPWFNLMAWRKPMQGPGKLRAD